MLFSSPTTCEFMTAVNLPCIAPKLNQFNIAQAALCSCAHHVGVVLLHRHPQRTSPAEQWFQVCHCVCASVDVATVSVCRYCLYNRVNTII